uniref:TGFb_propeptide domain-containing protein n=1 Tax=Bursaphelenchus xylophilus TaxID=6326 RepID=A0A1I7SE96_BURXY
MYFLMDASRARPVLLLPPLPPVPEQSAGDAEGAVNADFSSMSGRSLGAGPSPRAILSLLCILAPLICCATMPPNATEIQQRKQQALHTIKKTLETYSDEAIKRMLGPGSLPLKEEISENRVEKTVEKIDTTVS